MKRLASAAALALALATTPAAAQDTPPAAPPPAPDAPAGPGTAGTAAPASAIASTPAAAASPPSAPSSVQHPIAAPTTPAAPATADPSATIPAAPVTATPVPAPAALVTATPVPAPAALPPPPPDGTAATPPATQGPRTALIDAAPIGVDAAAARFVTETLRATLTQLGFAVVPQAELYDAARRLALPFPVPADGVYLLERALQTPVAVTAEVRAAHRMYIVRVRVRVAVEAMERVRDLSANQWQLGEALRGALPALLVPPEPGVVAAAQTAHTEDLPLPTMAPQRHYRAHPRHWELGAGLDIAFGPGGDSFVNYLPEARLGWFPMDRFGLTLTGAYGNLSGRVGRVSNFLTTVGVETSVDLIPSSHVFIPLRAEFGYLPNNGPVFRLTAGISFQLARRVHLEIDILSPTLWVLPETAPVSLDLAATLHYGL